MISFFFYKKEKLKATKLSFLFLTPKAEGSQADYYSACQSHTKALACAACEIKGKTVPLEASMED